MTDPSIVESVFLAALKHATIGSRSAFLDDACKDDPGLREQVNLLLAAHPNAAEFLEQPAAPAGEKTARYVPTCEQPGSIVAGRYKLLEMIGEGGMGEVWVADQLEPIRRRVALKFIKPGMDSRSVLARFEAERQALALMDHPNIAKVLDAGTAADSRPYFVMELVKGTPITEFCDTRKLSARERLELFIPVCQAIQHAHTKGIIHRDIKPSNVLVALHDERPIPKVIDFGIAKAVGQQLTEKTIYTGFGALVGTPAYMAPEQATFNQLDIDTRADVYALGVLLYELLAGSPPVEAERMKKAALDEVLRLVREEEPPRPSQRLSTSQSRASIAAVRQTDPERLTRLIRGELDWIVMKALEKDRTRRYETANGFAADVQRYLSGEPVQAVPPSVGYRLRKFVRKHRVAVITGMAFAGLLIASAAVSGWLAVQAKRASAIAEEKRIEAQANAEEADHNAWMYAAAAMDAETGRQNAELTAAGRQVDLDLVETRTDRRVGLLRLLQTLNTISGKKAEKRVESIGPKGPMQVPNMVFSEQRELREFVTAAVLTGGQEFSPLLPPITHDGHAVLSQSLSPDKQRLVTLGADGTARLWDTKTTRLVAVLRQGTERVVNLAFSSDSRTVFTDDQISVARFWDAANGKYRSAIEPRPNRYDHPKEYSVFTQERLSPFQSWRAALITGTRLLTRSSFSKGHDDGQTAHGWKGPAELWDTATGRLVARLDGPNVSVEQFQFLGDGRFVATVEGQSTVLVFSADDGKLLGRLEHPKEAKVRRMAASPSSQTIATISASESGKESLQVWDTASWKPNPAPMHFSDYGATVFRFLTDEVYTFNVATSMAESDRYLCRFDQPNPIAKVDDNYESTALSKELLQANDGMVFDSRSGKRLIPRAGRKFHPSLAKFAQDGRFFITHKMGSWLVVDTLADKLFELKSESLMFDDSTFGNLSGFGTILSTRSQNYSTEIRLLPAPTHLDLPAHLLELWAQVVVRGELGEDGRFVKWDEPTWEKNRRKLAAIQQPYPQLPFPGYVANDGLHWLRAEYFAATNEAEKQRLARELLRRAEANGDKSEALRWRAILIPADDKGPTPISK